MNPNQISSSTENFATKNYVIETFNSITPSSGTVTEINVGQGLCGSPSGSITNVGTISLDATLNDLTNVTVLTPVTNQVLTWNGLCWYPATFGGTGTSPIAFTDLSDTPSILTRNHLLESTDNSIILTPNNYINSVANGPGIGVPLQVDNEVRLEVDLNTFTTTTDSENNDQFIILQDLLGGTTEPRRIAQSDVFLENFKDSKTYIENTAKNSLTGSLPIIFDRLTGNISLTGSVMTGIDFTKYDINGVLPIENGGTSANTSFGARVNLGLSYNTDILAFEDPYYNGFMRGTNVRYAPGTASLDISVSGAGYGELNNYIIYNSETINLNVITGTTGEILSASLNGNYYDTLLYSGISLVVNNSIAPSTSSYVTITPEYSYVNFGLSQGNDGIGFRNKEGNIEYKHNSSVSWLEMETFISTITGMGDVNFSNTGNDNILVYKDGKYESTLLTGQAYIQNGEIVISGPIDSNIISVVSGNNIISEEFTTLQGISSNIQDQLNTKIHSLNNPVGSAILYYDSFSGTSPGWKSLNASNADKGKFLTVDFSPGISQVTWSDPFESIGNCMVPELDSTYDIGTSGKRWKNTFTDILSLEVYDANFPPSGISGNLAVFSNGDYGNPCLGLYWDSNWKIIGISGTIQT